jgi:hypothetical protein
VIDSACLNINLEKLQFSFTIDGDIPSYLWSFYNLGKTSYSQRIIITNSDYGKCAVSPFLLLLPELEKYTQHLRYISSASETLMIVADTGTIPSEIGRLSNLSKFHSRIHVYLNDDDLLVSNRITI